MDAAYAERVKLSSIAERLRPEGSRLPAMFLFTDPERTPDPAATVRGLPPGCGVVYRHFGLPERERVAREIRAACDAGGRILLIAADAELAEAVKADGLHWPRWLRMPGRVALRKFRLNSASAHGAVEASRAVRAGADIVFLSPVFRSDSKSAGQALGVPAARMIAHAARAPVYALGGVTLATAPLLIGTGIAGVAAIGALAGPERIAASARF